jgi:hypothetical protein
VRDGFVVLRSVPKYIAEIERRAGASARATLLRRSMRYDHAAARGNA